MPLNLKDFLQEIAELEAVFQAKLTKLGNPELASDFNDIITARKTYEILNAKRLREASPYEPRLESSKTGITDSRIYKTPFGITDATKDAIQVFKGRQFNVNDAYERVCELYPEDMASRNKTHVSATLSNLAANGIIIKVLEGKGGAPSIYELKPENEEAANLLPLSQTEETQAAVSA